jgi:hypothetical protein
MYTLAEGIPTHNTEIICITIIFLAVTQTIGPDIKGGRTSLLLFLSVDGPVAWCSYQIWRKSFIYRRQHLRSYLKQEVGRRTQCPEMLNVFLL